MTTNNPNQVKYTLKKTERLKSRATIQEIFNQNRVLKLYPYKLFYSYTDNHPNFAMQVGISVPKRNFRLAVHRNQIKRRFREAYRLNKQLLMPKIERNDLHLSMMFVYIGTTIEPMTEMQHKLKLLLIRLEQQINKEQKV